jgi:chemotaxis protein histidine kinase CheA
LQRIDAGKVLLHRLIDPSISIRGTLSMSDSDIVKDFLQESYENLDRLDRELVGLEKNPRDTDALASVFRTIHSIKGTCGFLGFDKLEKVAHVGENLLTRLRDGKLLLNPEITTGLLSMVDAVRQMLKEIESSGHDGDDTYPELLQTLAGLQEPADNSRLKGMEREAEMDIRTCVLRKSERASETQ